jgi:2'-5' RNA ligase
MRLFCAVDLEPAVASAASALADELRSRAARVAPLARITWIPPERMHLTVRFIGQTDDPLTAAILTALATPLQVAAFDLRVGGVGAFPRGGKPQVLWAAVEAGTPQLQAIEREVTRRLDTVGIPPETRPFHPHLTLARVREAAGLRTTPLFTNLENTSLGATRVETITLYESRLSPRGPTYRALQQISLQDA